jgi:hypothetical protein
MQDGERAELRTVEYGMRVVTSSEIEKIKIYLLITLCFCPKFLKIFSKAQFSLTNDLWHFAIKYLNALPGYQFLPRFTQTFSISTCRGSNVCQ